MDEREVQKVVGKRLEIVRRTDRMRSRIWKCSSCGAVTHSEEPIQIPRPAFVAAVSAPAMAEHYGKCNRRKVVAYHVEPESAWTTVVLNRWRD